MKEIAQRQCLRHQMYYEQRGYTWHLEEIVRDRDLVRERSKNFQGMRER